MSCSICLDDNCKKEYYVTDCNHIFHKECLLQIKNSKTNYMITKNEFTILNCPLCRKALSLYNLSYKTFNSEILDKTVFKYIKKINNIIKTSHLNKNYTFISGGFATALYSHLTNKNMPFIFNDIDIYYIDCHNLYDANEQKHYINNCKVRNINIKDVQKIKGIQHKNNTASTIGRIPGTSPVVYRRDDYIFELNQDYIPLPQPSESNVKQQNYDIIYLRDCTNDITEFDSKNKSNSEILEENILHTFNNYDLSCCKVAFTILDDYIEFYIHSDYYRKGVNICYYSDKKTKERINKYKERGHEFNKYTYCCNFDF
jgi:hypothetical protein